MVETITQDFVASTYGKSLIATGMTADQVGQGYQDLRIILEACGHAGVQKFAMTDLADRVLHEVLDTDALGTFVADVWGAGSRLVHDTDAWGTPEFAEAWRNTRAAFAEAGITLAPEAGVARSDGRAAAFCLIFVPAPVH
ncbi:MAG: hypothetical protein J0H82_06060 [Alphaproteobacteria bacterium]|jgi:hypothetical protein|nr:hypothetical protein [Alphaproteobacteria bacterium]